MFCASITARFHCNYCVVRTAYSTVTRQMQTGLDRLLVEPALQARLRGRRLAVLAHPASVDRELRHIVPLLDALGFDLRILFGPEHGFGGEAQDMASVADARDANGRLVRSLYGETFDDLIPKPHDLREADVLLIDLQDIGSRYYTFVWTALLAVEAAAKVGIPSVILDRPNPIGRAVEGRYPEATKYLSFVGLEPVPIRHGLTLGELVRANFARRCVADEMCSVIATRGVSHDAHAPDWDRAFVMPSPNMPTYATALVYPGGCLLEGTNLSEGRGTTRPFELLGAPWLNGERLASALRNVLLPGVALRPLTFVPTFHKYAGQLCGGVQVHVTDATRFRPVATYAAIIAAAHALTPNDFHFRTERYEYVDDVPAFDLLTGGATTRRMIESGESPAAVANYLTQIDPEQRRAALALRA
jgi:uncharacterized protein YbbC (DUF1343 family)